MSMGIGPKLLLLYRALRHGGEGAANLKGAQAQLTPLATRLSAVAEATDADTLAQTTALQQPLLDAFTSYSRSTGSTSGVTGMRLDFATRARNPASQAAILDHALRAGHFTLIYELGTQPGGKFEWPAGTRPTAYAVMMGIQHYHNSAYEKLAAVVVSGFSKLSAADQEATIHWMVKSQHMRLAEALGQIHAAGTVGAPELVGPDWPVAEVPAHRAILTQVQQAFDTANKAIVDYQLLVSELRKGKASRIVRSDVTESMSRLARELVDIGARAVMNAERQDWSALEKYAVTLGQIAEGLQGINTGLSELITTYDTTNAPDAFQEAVKRLQDDAAGYVEATMGLEEKIRLAIAEEHVSGAAQ